jgi:hypothetical protein
MVGLCFSMVFGFGKLRLLCLLNCFSGIEICVFYVEGVGVEFGVTLLKYEP